MAWSSITESDLLNVVNAADLATLRAAALKDGQADPIAPTISLVVNLVRGYCAKVTTLGPDGTVPDTIKLPVLEIIAVRIYTRVGRDAGQRRQTAHDKAMEMLQAVADRKFRLVEDSACPIEVSAPTRVTSRETLSSLT